MWVTVGITWLALPELSGLRLQEGGGVEGAGGFVFVLEVDVDVAVFGEER